MVQLKKFYRDRKNGIIFGVCSGLSVYLADLWKINISATLLRILWVLMVIFSSGFGILIYAFFAIMFPDKSEPNL
ncbi:MAG: PspC domain-containing protein [Elusimicrobiota bacterium]|jgi:phage shock protein PspC (stress-responsive transcriptional regulator)|nr:PspC domain-containing protein [Elusimicrobiota bacterium]